MIPLSLYLHFPWCIQKCPYCDFNSHKNNEALYKPYIEGLVNDVVTILPYIWGRNIHSIFIGGGTPSLMPPELLERLFSDLRTYLNFDPNIEITMEANPGTVDRSYFKAYREIGVNRLSIGVQSLNNEQLTKIGRIHDRDEAIRAIETAHEAGFNEINCDLMFGLPGQTLEGAMADLNGVIAMNPTHISHYQLTLEPNTYFYRYEPELPRDEAIEAMQLEGYETLAKAGFEHYEVSAFAKKGSQCAHNTNYWEFGDYLGIGAGAHGKITMMGERHVLRTQMEKHPRTFVEASSAERLTITKVEKEDLLFEFFLNVLRLKRGVPVEYWEERTFLPFSLIEARVADLKARGLLVDRNDRLQASERGFLFANQILTEFLEE